MKTVWIKRLPWSWRFYLASAMPIHSVTVAFLLLSHLVCQILLPDNRNRKRESEQYPTVDSGANGEDVLWDENWAPNVVTIKLFFKSFFLPSVSFYAGKIDSSESMRMTISVVIKPSYIHYLPNLWELAWQLSSIAFAMDDIWRKTKKRQSDDDHEIW